MSGMFPPSLGSACFLPVVTSNCAARLRARDNVSSETAKREPYVHVAASIINHA